MEVMWVVVVVERVHVQDAGTGSNLEPLPLPSSLMTCGKFVSGYRADVKALLRLEQQYSIMTKIEIYEVFRFCNRSQSRMAASRSVQYDDDAHRE